MKLNAASFSTSQTKLKMHLVQRTSGAVQEMTEEEIQRRLDEGEDLVMEDDEPAEPISPVTKAAVAKDVAAA